MKFTIKFLGPKEGFSCLKAQTTTIDADNKWDAERKFQKAYPNTVVLWVDSIAPAESHGLQGVNSDAFPRKAES